MKILTRIIRNGICISIALTALIVFMAFVSVQSYAAGTHTVTVKFDPNKNYTISSNTTYRLYKVGTFDEDGKFVFIEPYASDIDEVPDYDKEDVEKWLTSAQAVADYIKENNIDPIDQKVAGDAESRSGFTFTGVGNGFYLITGTSTRVDEGNKVKYYWPRPMYIRVLNENPSYEMKPAEGSVGKLRVCKQWVGDDKVKDKCRPESITLHVSYDGQKKDDIILPHEGKWYYEWEPKKGEEDPEKWVVTEEKSGKIKKYYKVSDSSKFVEDEELDMMVKTITNTYDEPDEPDEPEEPEPTPPRVKTGDFNHMVSYALIFIAAMVLLVIAYKVWKNR